MQNVSGETSDAVSVRKSLSKLSDFQSDTAPCRVLHQAQGDKQEKTFWLKSSSKTNGNTQRDDAPLQRKMGLFPVYRLEEDVSLLKEGGVRLSVWALKACSYKTHPKPKHQGEAPRLFKGFFMVFVFSVAT